jgi:hypothetical protein
MSWARIGDLARPDHPQAQVSLDVAVEVLAALTGYMYIPSTQVTEMYDTQQTLAMGAAYYPVMINGNMVNVSTMPNCQCSTCGIMHRIRLRGKPVTSVIKVEVNGCALNPTEYVLLDHSVLGFLTPAACCGGCVTVRYRYGGNIPTSGKFAAIKLANELVESLDPDGHCKLPERVTSISRQGVSWTLLDPQDFLADGRTGIYEVDLFLKTHNPARAVRPARVFSPDRPRASTVIQEFPALADVLLPDDMVVVPGAPAGWSITDPYSVATLKRPGFEPRVIIDGVGEVWLSGTPSPDGDGITFLLPADVTAKIRWGACWRLVAHNSLAPRDQLLIEGEARTL